MKAQKLIPILFSLSVLAVQLYSQTESNDAPTLGPVVRAYYRALKTRDDRAIERVLQTKFLAEIRADMKEEHKTHIAAFMLETDRPLPRKIEVRNEKIKDNWGIAEVRGGVYLNWTPLGFVKEDGIWKLSGEWPPNFN